MVPFEFSIIERKRQKEDDDDVRFIMKNFIEEKASKTKLRTVLEHAYNCEKLGGNRGNRNMIRAIELLLKKSDNIIPEA